MLGLARKAGRLEIGEEPVGAACRARQAKLVLLACDAASNTFRRASSDTDREGSPFKMREMVAGEYPVRSASSFKVAM